MKSPFSTVHYIQTVCGWEGVGGGVLSCVVLETIFFRSLTLSFWPDSEPTKLLYHPKQNPRRGRGLRQINTCRKVPIFLDSYIWHRFLSVYRNLSTFLPCSFVNHWLIDSHLLPFCDRLFKSFLLFAITKWNRWPVQIHYYLKSRNWVKRNLCSLINYVLNVLF